MMIPNYDGRHLAGKYRACCFFALTLACVQVVGVESTAEFDLVYNRECFGSNWQDRNQSVQFLLRVRNDTPSRLIVSMEYVHAESRFGLVDGDPNQAGEKLNRNLSGGAFWIERKTVDEITISYHQGQTSYELTSDGAWRAQTREDEVIQRSLKVITPFLLAPVWTGSKDTKESIVLYQGVVLLPGIPRSLESRTYLNLSAKNGQEARWFNVRQIAERDQMALLADELKDLNDFGFFSSQERRAVLKQRVAVASPVPETPDSVEDKATVIRVLLRKK